MHQSLRILLPVLLTAGCSPAPPAASTPPGEPLSVSEEPHAVGLIDASIVFTDCPQVSNMNAKEAQRTMYKLVEGCDSVPGGTARFVATLSPNKQIELSTPDGATGTVPVCVLKHRLTHQVAVQKPCRMEVQMEERKEAAPDGSAAPAGSGTPLPSTAPAAEGPK